jgi:nitrogenase molybdenum-iron protein alpha/beta subunit
MNKELINIVNDFNNILLSLSLNIANVCPTSIIGTNIKDIEKQIKKKENFTKFIDLFCIKVLQYKTQIDKGEDDFFMNKDYKDDLVGQEASAFDYVLSFKTIWGQLKKENKQIVIFNMQMLCELSQQYFNYIGSA